MNIMELGAIGELVGGVAVIATLGYLAAQVRHSARASRSASYQRLPWAMRIRGIFAAPGAQAWWAEQRNAYAPGFRALIDDTSGAAVPVFSDASRTGNE